MTLVVGGSSPTESSPDGQRAKLARAFMLAVGWIQSQRCHINKCPVGVTTQDPRLQRALLNGTALPRYQGFWEMASAESFRPWSASEKADAAASAPDAMGPA
jgi:hypothetical protein